MYVCESVLYSGLGRLSAGAAGARVHTGFAGEVPTCSMFVTTRSAPTPEQVEAWFAQQSGAGGATSGRITPRDTGRTSSVALPDIAEAPGMPIVPMCPLA